MSIALRKVLVCLIAALAIGAVASAASASAATPTCFKVAVAGTGTFEKNTCTGAAGTKEYIEIVSLEKELGQGEWCAKVKTAGTGTFEDNACTKAKAGGEFIKVLLGWEVCEEVGTEKFEEHLCTKTSATGKWSWKFLEGAESFKTTSKGGEFELTAGGKSVHCTAVTDKGTISAKGTDKALEIRFTGCKNDPKTCTAESPGAAKGTIVVAGIPTQLVGRVNSTGNGVLADEFKQNVETKEFVTIEFDKEGAACPEYPTTKVKGQIAAEVMNLANGEVELIFPAVELKGNTLEAFGVKATLTGKDEVSLENGWASRAS